MEPRMSATKCYPTVTQTRGINVAQNEICSPRLHGRLFRFYTDR